MSDRKPKVAPIPRGFRSITPHITARNVAAAVAMYQAALGAKIVSSQTVPDSDTMIFAVIRIGNSQLTIGQGDVFGSGSVSLHLYVEDADAIWKSTTKAGFTVISPLKDRYWGDRTGLLSDPLGVRWSIGQRVARLSAKALNLKAKDAMEKAGAAKRASRDIKDGDAEKTTKPRKLQ